MPLLRGRDIQRFANEWEQLEDEKWLINTHNGLKDSGVHPIKVRENFPVLWKRLATYSDALERRLDKGDHWSNLRNCAYLGDFSKPKIIYPNMTKYLPFYLDTAEHFIINDKAFILTSEAESLSYLTAALNSTVFRCCFMDNFPNLGEDRRELRKIFMDKIPVKKPTPAQASLFEALVPMVQAAKSEFQRLGDTPLQNAASFLEEVIDACVMEVYFADHMTEKKLSLIEHVTPLLDGFNASASKGDQAQAALRFYELANDSKHPVRNILIRIPVDSPDLLAVIQKEGAV